MNIIYFLLSNTELGLLTTVSCVGAKFEAVEINAGVSKRLIRSWVYVGRRVAPLQPMLSRRSMNKLLFVDVLVGRRRQMEGRGNSSVLCLVHGLGKDL